MAPSTPSKSPTTPSYAAQLLRRAHSPTTANNIFADKFKHKTLILHSTGPAKPLLSTPSASSSKSKPKDARALRRDARNAKLQAQGRRRRKKPQPLSAAEKRRLCLFEIPKEERKYSIYAGLHRMWCAYMREVLGVATPAATAEAAAFEASGAAGHGQGGHAQKVAGELDRGSVYLTPQVAGPLLVSADFHGAEVEVVRSRCVSRVGVKGIVARDTKYTFEVVTRRDEVKILPKEHSIFRFEIPLLDSEPNGHIDGGSEEITEGEGAKPFVFELYGEQFQHRPSDRAGKKFKVHIPPDL